MKQFLLIAIMISLAGCASKSIHNHSNNSSSDSSLIELPNSAVQGGLIIGHVPAGSIVEFFDDTPDSENAKANTILLKVAINGRIVFGIGRDETLPKILHIRLSNGKIIDKKITITARSFILENINGVPEDTVNPPPDIAIRIESEQAEVVAARLRVDERLDFDTGFVWPVDGRISGVYGSQRIYNGTPKSWHSGLDVAAAQGTPVIAPAGGIITFAKPDLFLTGGTVLIDHGMGVSSNFLHLSQLDVKVGDRVEQGQIIGLVGATGRATGPHMHWGMNWLKVRIDPQLLVPARP